MNSTSCFLSSPTSRPIILSVDEDSPLLRFSVQLIAIAFSGTPVSLTLRKQQ
jgi:hypothetical protein